MNASWPKWIHASLNKKIRTVVTAIPVYAETDAKPEGVSDRLEFSWVGPHISEVSSGQYFLDITLVVLVTSIRTATNDYKVYIDQGYGQEALPTCIPVYKYGAEIADDSSQLGILVRKTPIEEFFIGHQDQTNRIRQVGFTANYRMDL